MICYLKPVTKTEIEVITDYWEFLDFNYSEFRYTVKEINKKHHEGKVVPVIKFSSKADFILCQPSFECQDCKQKISVKNRSQLNKILKKKSNVVCSECTELRKEIDVDKARKILQNYKDENIKANSYLQSLSIEEVLSLISILESQTKNNRLLGESLSDISITDIPSIDQPILHSLVEKNVLVCISELPPEVEWANNLLYGQYDDFRYDRKDGGCSRYRSANSLPHGVYMRSLLLDGVEILDVTPLLYQKLQAVNFSVDEVSRMHQTIKEIQFHKICQLVLYIGNEHKLPIDNSNVLKALLSHVAENYAPKNLFFTFEWKAKDIIVYMHKEQLPKYIAKHCFTRVVGDYIQLVEEKGYELDKTLSLPPEVSVSSFEALFSRLFLNGYFDWNRLSVKEITAIWLRNIHLSEEARGLLTVDTEPTC